MFNLLNRTNPTELVGSKLFKVDTFYPKFLKDINNCQSELIIECLFVTNRRLTALLPTLQKLKSREVSMADDYEINEKDIDSVIRFLKTVDPENATPEMAINILEEPAEKAMACLTLLPYLQPYLDGNKRTSRMIANAKLLAYDYPPISFFTAIESDYKGALLLFYEQGALGNFRKLVLEQLEYSSTHYFFKV